MEPKPCIHCRSPHFNDYDLCRYCMDEKQQELERRLRMNDGAASIATVSSWAIHGFEQQRQPVWRLT